MFALLPDVSVGIPADIFVVQTDAESEVCRWK